jgi:radical SAM superfamily enzyme YgiQ (UPF0313 family)
MGFWDSIAAEKHLIRFPETPHGPLAMIYPNQYRVGMASLGFQQVYRLFRESGYSVERVFFDKKGRETRSIENQTPLFRFPVIAVTYTYELDILNLITMFLRGGVSPLAEERGEDAPLVIMGGMATTSNPMLLNRIADVMVIGEGEFLVQRITQVLIQYEGKSRRQLLEALAEIPHVYVPAVHRVYERERFPQHAMERIDDYPSHSSILAQDEEFGGAFLLEMSRGCHYRCKFCIVHYMNGQARYRNFDRLIETCDRYNNQYRKIGLLGAAVADHPQVVDVTEWLVRHGKQVSTSSLRAEKISERFLDLLKAAGQHNITVAPETGGIESRKRMRKGVKDEKYLKLAEEVGKRRFPSLKLYFLIGCPEEDPFQEANDIIRFSKEINEVFTGSGGGRLTITVSPFVPKPATPWAGGALWDAKMVKKASRIIRKELTFRDNIRVPSVNTREARIETILTWAGPEITDELIELAKGELSIESAFTNFNLENLVRPEQESEIVKKVV